MQTISTIATQGGVGKTTLAVHIAAAAQADGLATLVLDLDPQNSATFWGDKRLETQKEAPPKTKLAVRFAAAVRLDRELAQAADEGYQLVIIDTPPTDTNEAKTAARLADVVLVPVQPGGH